jgi:hypothetical protein
MKRAAWCRVSGRVRCSLLLLALAACPAEPPAPVVEPEPLVMDHWSGAGSGGVGDATLGPVAIGRVARRLTVHQLESSMKALTGTGWTGTIEHQAIGEDGGNATVTVDALPFLGANLGRADYLNDFRENADVGPSFAKYLDNWVAESCWQVVSADYGSTGPGRRFVLELPVDALADGGVPAERHRASLENVRLARLHFQSVYTSAANAQAQLQPLLDTLEAEARRMRPMYGAQLSDMAGWALVCTLMLTDPEFVTY